jgi:predicted DNA-binding protein
MATSTENAKQKKRGRPATGTDPMIGFRSSPALTERLDRFAKKEGLSRSKAIRRLVEQGLTAK